jgi:Secretion system C-terminal sorting domain
VTTVNSQTICPSGTATLTAVGATTYSWSTGAIINPITVTPVTTTSYTVTGTSLGCTSTAVATVTIGAAIVPTVNSPTICAGGTATLTATGGTTYSWDTGSSANPLSVTPVTTTSYTVTATSGTCTGTAVGTVTVNPLPTVSFTPFATPVCDNASAFTLTGGSPAGGIYSGTSVSAGMFNPSVGMGMYLITYTYSDINTCTNSDTATVTVDLCSGIVSNGSYDVSLYPNPTNGMLNISINNANFSEMKISILDVQGKVVYNSLESNVTNEYKKEIALSDIAKGIYYIKFTSTNGVTVHKLIVQ